MRLLPAVLTALVAFQSLPALAIEPPPGQPPPATTSTPASPPDGAASQAEVKALAEEVRRLKLELSVPDVVTLGSYAGQGIGASRVFHQPKGLSIGGYGELVYTNVTGGRSWAEVLRLVLYAGFRFNDWIVFNSETEFEHGAREIGIEFAHVDFLFSGPLNLRVGNVLVPVGFVNENHEPIFFFGVYRPLVDRYVIPTTWNQLGGGLYGDLGPVRYKAFALAGLDAFGPEPLEASSWVRNARTGATGPAHTWGGVLNLNLDLGPASVGGSLYGGNAGQGHVDATGQVLSPWVTLGEVHALVAWRGLSARALLSMGWLSQSGEVSRALGLAPERYVGSRSWGGYVEAGYDLLTLAGSSMSLSPFFRFEALNPQAAVASGGVLDPALDQRVFTTGLDFKPIPQVVVKANWQGVTSGVPGLRQQWDVGVGFVY